jgi:serine/threonine protein kinase
MVNNQKNILFKKFRVIECLKKDTLSCVYLADHIYLNRKIILKTLDTNNLADKTVQERFKREGKILAALDHPNIIKVFDFGNWKNFFYISFEYFPGDNLRQFFKTNRLRGIEKESLIIQLTSALKIAHQHHIIHRDLKPENILIDQDLHIKIADFGLALICNESGITLPTSIVGTPAYMSPEQICGVKLTEKSDLFSLGIIIYELYLGHNPFLGKDTGETLNNILSFNLDKIKDNLKNLPEKIQLLITQLLEKDIKKRIGGTSQILQLFDIKEEKAAHVRSYAGYKWAFVGAVLILIITGMIYLIPAIKKTPPFITSNHQLKKDSLSVVAKTEHIRAAPALIEKEKSSELSADYKASASNVSDKEIFQEAGNLYIECQPWAYIYLDEVKIDSTPMSKPLALLPKQYSIKLVHPQYPPFHQMIDLSAKQTVHVKVDFDTLVGFFNCKVYPWGKIFINGQYKGVTPLDEPIRLIPGIYQLAIINPKYKEYNQQINIIKQDTLNIKFNFDMYQHTNNL